MNSYWKKRRTKYLKKKFGLEIQAKAKEKPDINFHNDDDLFQ